MVCRKPPGVAELLGLPSEMIKQVTIWLFMVALKVGVNRGKPSSLLQRIWLG